MNEATTIAAANSEWVPTPAAHPLKIVVFAAFSWLIPGLGHFLAGDRKRGIVLLILIGSAFGAGLALSDLEAVSRSLHPYAFYAEIGVGAPTMFLVSKEYTKDRVMDGKHSVQTYDRVPPYADAGLLFCSIAGLLNFLLILDLVERMLGGPVVRRRDEK